MAEQGEGAQGAANEQGQGSEGAAGAGEGQANESGTAAEQAETVTLTKAEHDALKSAAASAARRAREAEREARTRAEQEAQAAGRHEELYNTEKQRRETLEGKLTTAARRDAAREVAGRLRFRNPELAARLVTLDDVEVNLDADTLDATVDATQAAIIERRLTAAAEADPYLLTDGPGRMLPGAGGNGQAAQTGNAAMNAAIRAAAGRG